MKENIHKASIRCGSPEYINSAGNLAGFESTLAREEIQMATKNMFGRGPKAERSWEGGLDLRGFVGRSRDEYEQNIMLGIRCSTNSN